MIRYTFHETARNVLGNPGRCWNPELFDSDLFAPHYAPKFTVDRSTSVFAFGSCFADHVKRALRANGLTVLSTYDSAPAELFKESSAYNPVAFFHRYNPPSMLLELQNLFGRTQQLHEPALIVHHPEGVRDFHYSPNYPLSTVDLAMHRRALVRQRFSAIRNAGLFIFTLGLTETWFDGRCGLYCNAQSIGALRANPERYEFRNLDTNSVRLHLEAIIALIREEVPGARIVFTVSPVPMEKTCMPTDVATANSYTKATLLAAVRDVEMRHADVGYFPSYEMATLTRRSAVWRQDNRHIKDEFVDRVMAEFARHYLEQPLLRAAE
jgi:hypothetical protein